MVDFLISVACYNNESEVIKFAQGLQKQTISDRIKLVVTCNSCSEPESFSEKLKETFKRSEVYVPEKNLGYLNGCLNGFKKQAESYRWGLISNTDIDFSSDDFFEKVLSMQNDEVWCIGPDIVLADSGIHQNPYRVQRATKFRKWYRDFIFSHYILYMIYLYMHYCKVKFVKKNTTNLQSGFVYAVHGSCFILRNDCINAMLAENNEIFMYDEEFFVAEVVFKNKKQCFFNVDLKLLHNEHQTTGFIKEKTKQKWFKQSIRYLKKFY